MKSPRTVFQFDPEFWQHVTIRDGHRGVTATEHNGRATNDRGGKEPQECWTCTEPEELAKVLKSRGIDVRDQYKEQDIRRQAFIQFWGEGMVNICGSRVPFDDVQVIAACANIYCLNPLHLTVTLKSGVYPKGLKTVFERVSSKHPKGKETVGFQPQIDRQLIYRKVNKELSMARKQINKKTTLYDDIKRRIIGDKGGYRTHKRIGVLSDTCRFFNVPMKNVLLIYFDMIKNGEINP